MLANKLNSLIENKNFIESKAGKSLLETPLSFIDIGARGGAHEIVEPIAKLTSVLGFEPDLEECKRLLKLPDVTEPWANITIEPIALYDKDGDAELVIVNESTNTSLLPPNKEFTERYNMKKWQEVGRTKLKTTTLDKVIESKKDGVKYGEFIKIDTQGTEFEILKGSINTIKNNTNTIIAEVSFCELYSGQKLFAELEMLLRDCGFSFYGFVSMHGRSKKLIDKRNHVTAERTIYANVIFFKDPLPLNKKPKMDDRSIYTLFTSAILNGYYDFAYELATETWLKTSDEAENKRVKKLIEEVSYLSPENTKSEIENIAESARSNPDKSNIIAGNFVDRRRKFCDYDDVLNISSLPKTQ